VNVFLASWCCEGAWFGLSDSFSRPTTLSRQANEKAGMVIFPTAAASVCGAGQKYGIYYSCTAAVNESNKSCFV
jgi:hypothetical protein